MKYSNYVIGTAVTLLSFLGTAHAQVPVADTLRLSVPDAEALFLKNNLSLLAAQYGVDASKALIQQAKLWDNPVLNTDQNLYDGKFFRHNSQNDYGQWYVQIQQLVLTGGKRSKLVKMASTNADMSQIQFNDVMRNLKYKLRTDLSQVNQLLETRRIYAQELVELKRLTQGMQLQLQAGNVSQKDYLRLQAEQLNMQQSILDVDKDLRDNETELITILQVSPNSFVVPTIATDVATDLPTLDTVFNSAKVHNPDYLYATTQLKYQQLNLSYQKALRAPDLQVGVSYDKQSSYTPNLYGLEISLPLPLINRNQGNIKSAQYTVKQQQVTVQQTDVSLQAGVQNAYQKLWAQQELAKSIDPNFYSQYATLIQKAIDSYRLRQLGLVEFLDLFDSYKDTHAQFLQQQYNLVVAKEDLNFQVGADVVK